MPPLTFRAAVIQDVDAIVRLVNRAFVAESPYVEGERLNPDLVREMWPRGTFLLGELEGALVACIFIEPRAHQAHLGLVSVEPARQGEGLGAELMNAAESRCRAAGFREMELRFIDQRTELERFYQRLGFTRTGVCEPSPPARAKIPFHFVQMIKSVA